MELTSGVKLHFIKTQQFKTWRIKIRFSAPIVKDQMASRTLVASMIEEANRAYPTTQAFRQKLASLYGAQFSTNVGRRGLVHYVDIDVEFLSPHVLSGQDLTEEMLSLLKTSLQSPLTQADSFDSRLFDIEQRNLINDLKGASEDNFYQAGQALDQLFYQREELQISHFGTVALAEKESPQTTFRTFQKMMKNDRIDIFCLGQFDEEAMKKQFQTFSFQARQVLLELEEQQGFSKVMREKIEKKEVNQSILELAYHLPLTYATKEHSTLLVLNGLLGEFSSSKLFVNVREKRGLAYTIGSQIDSLTACLKIYAGIEKNRRREVMKVIHRQWLDLKNGQFSLDELEQAKSLVASQLLSNKDRAIYLMELAYQEDFFGKDQMDVDKKLTEVDEVCKDDLINLANKIKLQALYFMEGEL